MKYNTYYYDKDNRMFVNIASTFIIEISITRFKRAFLEGERIQYE
jgi:hypothetical protein